MAIILRFRPKLPHSFSWDWMISRSSASVTSLPSATKRADVRPDVLQALVHHHACGPRSSSRAPGAGEERVGGDLAREVDGKLPREAERGPEVRAVGVVQLDAENPFALRPVVQLRLGRGEKRR